MKKRETISLIFLLSGIVCFSQNPVCTNNYVYMDAPGFINYYDPVLPISGSNPAPTNIPSFGSGLTLMPNISGGTLSPTFYAVSSGTYWYWSGATWVNTGHSTGNASAVNIAGCGSTIYNIVGSTGQVYAYNGSGTGTLLTTIPGFNGGGPYDLVTDCNCNFYVLNTTTPNQGLSMYNSNGVLQCTYTLSGMPSISSGGGFAIIGNMIYVKNNGFYVGTITTSGVTFSAVTSFTNSPSDFASCSVCYSSILQASLVPGATLDCNTPTTSLAITTTISPVSYQWSGPGIAGSPTGASVCVNAPGTYSCLVSTLGCPPAQVTLTTNVISHSIAVNASLTPSGTICAETNKLTLLSVPHSITNNLISWTGPGITTTSNTNTINVGSPGSYTVAVKDLLSGCTGTDVVTIHKTPTVGLALSSTTLCLQNYNGSPASITLTPSGATNYTLLAGGNFSTSAPNATLMPCFPQIKPGNLIPVATATLIGSSGTCADSTVASFTLIPNPTLTLSTVSASICPGESATISVSGASQYSWSGPGLSANSGSSVAASPTLSSTYTVAGADLGCSSQTQAFSVIVLPIPSISVNLATSTVCLGSSVTLSTSGTATSFTWFPSNSLSSANGSTVSATPLSALTYSVIGSLNTCTNSASTLVNVMQPPLISMNLSSQTVCARNYNNSPNSITITPSGATNYTLSANSGITITSPSGPVMQAVATGPLLLSPYPVTLSLTGKSGVCTVVTTHTFNVLPNPVISVSPSSASVCPGDKYAFTASGANTYSWLPMPNYTITGNNSIVANPTLTSFYPVIGGNNGCNSDTRNAVLVILAVPDVSVSPNTPTICAGNGVSLKAMGNASHYQWSPSVSLSSTSGVQVTASPSTVQTYVVKATLNTCTNQAVTTVSVIEIPVVQASTSQSVICSDASTILKASGANSFIWLPNINLNTSEGNVVTASPHKSTTYTVHGYNGVCTGSTTIYVKTVERPDMNLTASVNQVCPGSTATLSVTGGQSYTWIPVSGLISPNTHSTVTAAPIESTSYTVIGANSLGSVSCYEQLNYSIIVSPLIHPSVSRDVVYLCEGEKATLYAKGGNTFSWTPSYGLNVTHGSGVVANPKVTTIYTVEVSDNTYCGQSTTVMVAVSPKPEVFAGRDTSYNLSDAVFIEAKGTGTLTWIMGEGIVCPSCPLTLVQPTRSGCYVVEAMNEFGCRVTDNVCVELTEDFTAYIPNSFTPNHDGINDVFLIYGENISNVSMEIYNRWGEKLFYSGDFRTGWDGNSRGVACPPGIYTYVIKYTGLNRKKYEKTGSVSIIK